MGFFKKINEARLYKKNSTDKYRRKIRQSAMENELRNSEQLGVFYRKVIESVETNLPKNHEGYYMFSVDEEEISFLTLACKSEEIKGLMNLVQDTKNPALALASWATITLD